MRGEAVNELLPLRLKRKLPTVPIGAGLVKTSLGDPVRYIAPM
jgi:hypothetical protein